MLGTPSTLLLLLLMALSAVASLDVDDETFHRKLASRLLKHCLQDDVWACVAYKGHHFLQGHPQTASSADLAQRQVDKQLQGAFDRLLGDSIGIGLSSTSSQARGKLKFLGPLLGGLILKFVSLIPLVLGTLAFLGIQSVIASKLSLGIAALLGLKKLYQGDVQLQPGGLEAYQLSLQQQYQQAQAQYLDPYNGGVAKIPETHEQPGLAHRRRVFVIRKGREFLPDTETRLLDDSEPWMDNSI